MFRVVLGSRAPLAPMPLGGDARGVLTGLVSSARVDGNIGLVTLAGELRVESIPRLDAAVEEAKQGGALHLLLDLSGLVFMDSASAGTLIRIRHEQMEQGARLVLFGLQRMVARLIDAAGLGDQFEVAADEEGARILLGGL